MRPVPSFLAALVVSAPLLAAAQPSAPSRPPAPVVDAAEAVHGRRALRAALDAVRLPPGSTLELEQVWSAPGGGKIVRFLQRHQGLEVQHAVVNVRLDADGRARRVTSSVVPLPGGLPTRPLVSAAEAVRIARSAAKILQPAQPGGRAWLVYTPSARLAWEVPIPSLLPVHALLARVDALTGELLAMDERAKSAGEANVWPSAKVAFEARRADRSFDTTKLLRAPLAGLASTEPAATLNAMTDPAAGLVGFNCCPTEGCDPAAPLAHKTGTFSQGGIDVPFDIVFCDERQTATADADGNFLYLPPAEPDPDPGIRGPQPSDGDTFSEVQAYSAARRMLDYMVALDPGFSLGPNARPARVTANFMLPDFSRLEFDPRLRAAFIGEYARFDNALFLPAESTRGIDLPIPGLERPFDSLIFGQGTRSDFAYDDDVVAHELSHGTVNATARLADYAADDWGVLDAPGAMNEGFADYWAAALANDPAIGEYVGDLSGAGEGALRRLDNDFSCPTLLRGQVHNDSQHFSAALWGARAAAAATADRRLEWDRGVLAAMRMMTPTDTFEAAAATLEDEVEAALPGARAALEASFAARGVTGCERFLEPSDAKVSGLVLAPASGDRGWGNYAPGPVQVRLTAPAGATSLRIVAQAAAAGFDPTDLLGGGDGAPELRALVKRGSRLNFSYAVTGVSSDQDLEGDLAVSGGGDPVVQLPLDAGCGATVFVALANRSPRAASLQQVAFTWNVDAAEAAACAPPPAPDAGPAPTPDAGDDGGGGDPQGGCGCGTGTPFGLALAGFLALFRRRRAA